MKRDLNPTYDGLSDPPPPVSPYLDGRLQYESSQASYARYWEQQSKRWKWVSIALLVLWVLHGLTHLQ